jgi:DNA-binding NtrC family response regulator
MAVRRRIRLLTAGVPERQRRELETMLGDGGARLVHAATGIEAWKRLHELAFDVAMVGDGIEGGWRDLVAEIAGMGLAVPVVLASARPDDRLWVEALTAGVYDVLVMPFHAAETGRVLAMATHKRRRAAVCLPVCAAAAALPA